MKTRWIAYAALIVLLAAGVVAQTAPQAPRPPQAPQAPHAPMGAGAGELLGPGQLATFLNLTAAQIDQAKALRAKFAETMQPIRDEQKANAEALKAAMEAGDALKAGQALLAGKAVREKVKAAADAQKGAFAALLTPAQKAKFDVYQEILALHRQGGRGPNGAGAGLAPLPPLPPMPPRF